MKRALSIAAVCLSLALCLAAAMASGGSAADPLISLSYLKGTFLSSVGLSVDSRLDSADSAVRSDLQRQLDTMSAAVQAAAGQSFAAEATEYTCKQGDILIGSTGLSVIPLSGEIRLEISDGAVVDVTAGCEVPSGSILSPRHRYIAAEQTAVRFVTESPAAVLTYQGSCAFSLSGDTPDYYAIACALRELGLFRGTGTSFGEGFDLHLAPTRAEALVMFIRLLGEENAALSCSYEHPFTDVPTWADRYVAWAWHQGYSNGVGGGKFGTQQPVSASEYQEFLLRALGYSVAGVHDYTTSLDRAYKHGALTSAEYQMLQTSSFLRCQTVYLSYYSLDMVRSGSQQTLAQQLSSAGVFSAAQLTSARQLVTSPRLS